MKRLNIKKVVTTALLIGLLLGLIPIVIWGGLTYYYNYYTLPIDELPPQRVAIVFGARVYPNGQLSGMLRDRVEMAVQLYEAGKVQKLIMSGDNRFEDYNEPDSMTKYAISRGVPAADIQPDYAGRRTYDTCYRAKAIFGVTSAVLVTQNFHLPRALFICRNLGIDAVGVSSDISRYSQRSLLWSEVREVFAQLLSVADVIRQPPAEVLGEPIPLE